MQHEPLGHSEYGEAEGYDTNKTSHTWPSQRNEEKAKYLAVSYLS